MEPRSSMHQTVMRETSFHAQKSSRCSEKTGSCVNHSDFTKTYRIMKALVSNPVQKAMHQATNAEQGTGRD